MSKTTGTNVNVSGEAQLGQGVSVNSTMDVIWSSTNVTGTTPPVIPEFTNMWVSNVGNRDAYIKLQPAATDSDVKGIYLRRNSSIPLMQGGDVYTGEVSARTANGSTTIYVTVW